MPLNTSIVVGDPLPASLNATNTAVNTNTTAVTSLVAKQNLYFSSTTAASTWHAAEIAAGRTGIAVGQQVFISPLFSP